MDNLVYKDCFYSFSEIMKDNSNPPPPIIDNGILLKNTLLLINGQQKVGKSFLIGNLGLAMAKGISFACFKITKPFKVLIFSTEGGRYPNRDRIKKMAVRASDIKDGHFNVTWKARYKVDDNDDFERLKQVITDYKPDVVIFDPFVHFHNSEENSASDMSNVLGRFRQLIEDYDISIILVHHSGKGYSKDARGSSVILGEYDSNIIMSREKCSAEVKLEFDMRHVKAPENCTIVFDKDTNWFESIEDKNKITDLLKSIAPIKRSDFSRLLVDEGMYTAESNASKAIKNLIDKKKIILNKSKKLTLTNLSLNNFSDN